MNGIHLSARGMDYLYRELSSALDDIIPLTDLKRMGVNGI
jgi:hypothetical protein